MLDYLFGFTLNQMLMSFQNLSFAVFQKLKITFLNDSIDVLLNLTSTF